MSADNAIVLAVLVMPLPPDEQKKALKYGIIGAFVFRVLAVILAVYLLHIPVIKIVGGLYLAYLAVDHFFRRHPDHERRTVQPRKMLGFDAFWSTVVLVELTDIVFSVDSILAAVALSPKQWVVIAGGILGIVTMRLVAGAFLGVIKRFPALVDGAYIVVFFIGMKLFIEYFDVTIPKWITFLVVIAVLLLSMSYSVLKEERAEHHL